MQATLATRVVKLHFAKVEQVGQLCISHACHVQDRTQKAQDASADALPSPPPPIGDDFAMVRAEPSAEVSMSLFV